MNINKMTLKMQEALQAAQELASTKQHSELSDAHVLLALLQQPEGLTPPLLGRLVADADQVENAVASYLDRQPSVAGATTGQVYLGTGLRDTMAAAEKRREQLKDEYLSVEHFLLGLLDGKSDTAKLLTEAGIDADKLLAAVAEIRGSQSVTDQDPEGKYQAL